MSQIETTFRYNGVEFFFDARDAEYAERMEQAVAKMEAEEKLLPKDGKASDIIKANCKLIKDFFDTTLGDGAGIAICSERNNVSVCFDAYKEFLKMVRAQNQDVANAKSTFAGYSNRQQRRHGGNGVKPYNGGKK